MIGYFSSGIGKIPHLAKFLGEPCDKVNLMSRSQPWSSIAGWGWKQTSENGRQFAEKKGIPYLALEDGFLRSLNLGINDALRHSLIVDQTGIYYDAFRSSDLEEMIRRADYSEQDIRRAASCIHLLRHHRLSKYNHAPDESFSLPIASDSVSFSRVLVVDQTRGDASIDYGMANEDSFKVMLESAINDNPEAEIIVKIHPDVIAGKKQGYLSGLAREKNCTIVADDVSAWALLDRVSKVYVVTSQLGFEALMAEKQVYCFGMPFYAGWGVTHDNQACDRRGVSRSLKQIFFAAYIEYARYINPYTGEQCEIEDTISLIAHQKKHMERFRGDWFLYGFIKWKRGFIPEFLGPAATINFIKSINKTSLSLNSVENFLAWSSKLNEKVRQLAKENNLKIWCMEDGFLRSVGLGKDEVKPVSLVVDQQGIYYDATMSSDLESLLATYEFDDHLLIRAHNVRSQIVRLGLSKYNIGIFSDIAFPPNRKIILVPGQVESDASIAKGSALIKTNHALLETVRQENPDAYIIYKPHPDVFLCARKGAIDKTSEHLFDLQVTESSITSLLDNVDEVHTMTSLAGFEALLREKKVVTYGMPFYAGWGLTEDKLFCERRGRKLTLDELVAATLILYPIYVDPDSGDVCDVETAIEIIKRNKGKIPKAPVWERIKRQFKFLYMRIAM